jgi:hypothetical protein
MVRKRFALATSALVTVAFVLSAVGQGVAGAQGQRSAPFADEQVWNAATNDWEPTVATDPSSSYVYQMTTRYGGPSVCQSGMQHCIRFRASSDGGTTWGTDRIMCPGTSCKGVHAQNDPQVKVASNGVVYAAWMNDYDVTFATSSDHGATWTTPIDVRTGSGLTFTDKPILLISPTGHDVYVAFNASDSYVVASHDGGVTFSAPVKTNSDTLYWFAEGGAIAPNGTPYLAESAENQNATGPVQLFVLTSANGGSSWTTIPIDTSQQQPTCTVKTCTNDFYGSQESLAIDRNGLIMVAYGANNASQAPLHLFVRTSSNGGSTWSARSDVSVGGAVVGANFPELVTGSAAGDFRVAFQDDRNGATAWNTWYRSTTNGGGSWTAPIRLSNLGSGAPYKGPNGYAFPYGDFFGLAVGPTGLTYAVWGEGSGYAGPGGTWFTRG